MKYDLFFFAFFLMVAIGVFSALIGYMLDTLLDRGHIFGRLRYLAALRAANKMEEKRGREVSSLLKRIVNMEVEQYDPDRYYELLHEIAYYRPGFKAWTCSLCMSLRINLFLSIFALLFFLSLSIWVIVVSFPIAYLGSAATTHFVISRL